MRVLPTGAPPDYTFGTFQPLSIQLLLYSNEDVQNYFSRHRLCFFIKFWYIKIVHSDVLGCVMMVWARLGTSVYSPR